jgi:membrane-bound lytic murein transglycosylase D
LQATVSQLPLQMTDAVLSYINYFSSERGRRSLVFGLKRAGRYKPLIQRILAEEGVPQELIYLAQAESGFLPRAVSNKAAVGMWQFVQWRGRQYGLNQSAYTDDRLDPEKATRSAARHLRDLYEKFGDWYLAIAGYNCGDGCVERAVQRTGYADFWALRARNAIPKETTNYVPIIVAMTIMHKNAKDYGLEEIVPDEPLTYDTIELDAPTHLALVADIADRPVSEIREMNPSLLSSVAPAGFQLHVPEGAKTSVIAGLGNIPAQRRASWRVHRVGPGDTIESIARRYNMPVNSIASLNNQADAEIGDVLIIPTASQVERLKVSNKKTVRKGNKVTTKSSGATVKSAKSSKGPATRRMASTYVSSAGLN